MTKRFCVTCNKTTEFVLNKFIGHSECTDCGQRIATTPTSDNEIMRLKKQSASLNQKHQHLKVNYIRVVNKLKEVRKACYEDAKIGVENIHDKLDNLNGKEGNLCLYCKTDKHNALGITHRDDCVIVEIRRLIRYLESEAKK